MLDGHGWDIQTAIAAPDDLHLEMHIAAREQAVPYPVEPGMKTADFRDHALWGRHVCTDKPFAAKVENLLFVGAPIHDR